MRASFPRRFDEQEFKYGPQCVIARIFIEEKKKCKVKHLCERNDRGEYPCCDSK